MYLDHAQFEYVTQREKRTSVRKAIQCRARIRIGDRYYAGYLHNISPEGAKLRTVSHIRRLGRVVLMLPDLPPLVCALRWHDNFNAGVQFEIPLPTAILARWILMRPTSTSRDAEIDWVEASARS